MYINNCEWVDLKNIHNVPLRISADHCVIGGGTIGIYLGMMLALAGLSVLIVEAGDLRVKSSEELGIESIFENTPYRGATEGRGFGIGGSSAMWGGVLVGHSQHDVRSHLPFEKIWRYVVEIVRQNQSAVFETLGLKGEALTSGINAKVHEQIRHFFADSQLSLETSFHLPFRLKNLSVLLNLTSKEITPPKILFNAVSKKWSLSSRSVSESNIKELSLVSENGNTALINAKKFIIAAGAIESTRILLEINDGNPSGFPVSRNSELGKNLSDHLSFPAACVENIDVPKIIKYFSPSFYGKLMGSARLVNSAPKAQSVRGFGHFIFNYDSKGINAVKNILKSIQSKTQPSISVADLTSGLADIGSLMYMRYINSKMYIPKNATAFLQVDVEQARSERNSITLSKGLDRFGRRIPLICWDVSELDIENCKKFAHDLLSGWPKEESGFPQMRPNFDFLNFSNPYDVYHPTGTIRMGDDNLSVVDMDLRVRGFGNLWVVSTAVLPSAGTANPTFTTLCLAHQLGQKFIGEGKRGD